MFYKKYITGLLGYMFYFLNYVIIDQFWKNVHNNSAKLCSGTGKRYMDVDEYYKKWDQSKGKGIAEQGVGNTRTEFDGNVFRRGGGLPRPSGSRIRRRRRVLGAVSHPLTNARKTTNNNYTPICPVYAV
eukprot:11460752-Heterocapsa_arctica.AAC.1